MKKSFKKWVASIVVALSITMGAVVVAPVANATPAHAVTTWYVYKTYCDWVYVYQHYDYNWWEELWGYKDYDRYLYRYYKYNWYCHNLKPY